METKNFFARDKGDEWLKYQFKILNKKSIMNPAFEEALQKALEEVYDNRLFLTYNDLKNLKRIANKK